MYNIAFITTIDIFIAFLLENKIAETSTISIMLYHTVQIEEEIAIMNKFFKLLLVLK